MNSTGSNSELIAMTTKVDEKLSDEKRPRSAILRSRKIEADTILIDQVYAVTHRTSNAISVGLKIDSTFEYFRDCLNSVKYRFSVRVTRSFRMCICLLLSVMTYYIVAHIIDVLGHHHRHQYPLDTKGSDHIFDCFTCTASISKHEQRLSSINYIKTVTPFWV